MVRSRLRVRPGLPGCSLVLALVLAVVGLLSFAGAAEAANTRVSITDFRWSQDPTIDLGERVIWDWLGPDTAHSVTGRGPGGRQVDSDPATSFPQHRVGDSFEVSFDQPGTFTFACKIHSAVRGTVTVSDIPGDPGSDPGPQPPLFFDDRPPFLSEVTPKQTRLGPRGRGGGLSFGVDERATADLEYWRLPVPGSPGAPRFAGISVWRTFIGFNRFRYASRTKAFPARPGRYEARLRVTDPSGNITGPVTFRFEIRAPKKAGATAS